MAPLSVSEVWRQVSKVFGPARKKIRSEREAETEVVLTYAQRTRIMQWIDASEEYQDDFRLDAPPDFTVWERLPDGSLLPTVQQQRKPPGAPREEPHEYAQPQERAHRDPGVLARAMPCLEPFLNVRKRQTVHMARLQLQDFPEDIVHRGGKVRDVDLSFNRIDVLPPEACESLTRLTTLNLGNNLLEELPEEIGMMTKLSSLNLSRNKIADMPEHFRKLVRLHTLDLHDNLITEISEGFGLLIALQDLDVGRNRVEHVSGHLGLCPLRRLNLSSNQITVLDEGLDELWETLEELHLHENELQYLPMQLVHFHRLRSVTFNRNMMVYLPEDLGSVVHMDRLEAQHNKLRKLPQTIGHLVHLTLLCVHNNGLERLPEGVGRLTSLTVLNVQCNRLAKLPDGLHRLTRLLELTAQSNKLGGLPERGLGSLVKLETLLLNNNQIERVGPESGLQDLPSLTTLDMDDNLFHSEDLNPSLKAMFHRLKGSLPVSTMARMNPDEAPGMLAAEDVEETPVQNFDADAQSAENAPGGGSFAPGDSVELKSRSETSRTKSTRLLNRTASTATSGWGSMRAVKHADDDDQTSLGDEEIGKSSGFFSSFLRRSFMSSKGSGKQRNATFKTGQSFSPSKPMHPGTNATMKTAQSFTPSKPLHSAASKAQSFSPTKPVYSAPQSFSAPKTAQAAASDERHAAVQRASTVRSNVEPHHVGHVEPSTTSPDTLTAKRERPKYGRSHTVRVSPTPY